MTTLTGRPAHLPTTGTSSPRAPTSARAPLAVRLLGRDPSLAVARRRPRRRARPLPTPRGAAVARPRRGRLPGVRVPRLDVRRRRPLRRRAVGGPRRPRCRRRRTCRPSSVDRALRPGVDVPGHADGDDPVVAEEDDPAYRRINSGVDVWTASATRMTDNFLDISHFPYVHTGTFGLAANTEVPKFEIVDARRRLRRLRLRGRGGQRGRQGGVGARRRR